MTQAAESVPFQKVEVPLRLDGPRVSLESWRTYSFIIATLRRSNRRTLWLRDDTVIEGAKIQRKDFKKVITELKTNGYLATKQSRAGCEYSVCNDCAAIT